MDWIENRARLAAAGLILVILTQGGCAHVGGKITGTPRSGTEQLLLTGAVDRAIRCLDFRPLAGALVFLDATRVGVVDKDWIVFALRRAMAEQGVLLADSAATSQVIVEAAVGAYGTDERDTSLSLPGVGLVGTMPVPVSGIVPGGQALSKKGRQFAAVKLALFAYDTTTRRLVWQSGTILNDESVGQHSVLGSQLTRESSLPELERYPPRRPFWGRIVHRDREMPRRGPVVIR